MNFSLVSNPVVVSAKRLSIYTLGRWRSLRIERKMTWKIHSFCLEIRVTKASGYVATFFLYFSNGKGIVQISLPVQTYIGSEKSEGYGRLWQKQNF